MSFLSKLFFNSSNQKEVEKLQPLVDLINGFENEFQGLSAEEIKVRSVELKKMLSQGHTKEEILPKAFALVREVAKRTLKQRHFDTQLMGGIVLHQGKIVEMKTGEGKTLSSTCPIYLNALDGSGVHVITVNDYLARRDTVWMGQIYRALGLSVACLVHDGAFAYDPEYIDPEPLREEEQGSERDKERDKTGSFKVEQTYLRPISRKEAYQCDITYGTNNEFGFDYLRDNLVHNLKDCVQRELNYAIVDEIDSILIDEARTPLIISAPAGESANLYYKLSNLVKMLKSGEDYLVDEKLRTVILSEEGIDKITSLLEEDPWANNNLDLVHHIDAALKAMVLFQQNRDYVKQKGEIIIIDEFTGRLMQGRRYSDGLHQAIEAKEGVDVKQESRTLATITFQNYFRFYKKLCGMTGTAETEAEEFHKIYNLDVITIPTNKPTIRKDLADRIYRTKKAKFSAIIEDVKERHSNGQPILIGTGGFTIGEKTVGAIEKNRIIKDLLEKEGIHCKVLDATSHEKEGQIIAQAGRLGAVTVATNMAGRGVDIVLGGNPFDIEKQKEIVNLGGLHIIGSERHESRRIDNQLRGRAGRQGDDGSSQFFLSLDDDLMRIFGGSRLASLMQGLKIPDDIPIESKIVSNSVGSAQRKIEGFNFDTRKHLLEYDDILSKHRETVYRLRKRVLKMNYKDLAEDFLGKIKIEIEKIVKVKTLNEKIDISAIAEIIKKIFPTPDDLVGKLKSVTNVDDVVKYIFKIAREEYKNLEIEVNLKEKKIENSIESKPLINRILLSIYLETIDRYWISHLQIIDNLKGGIGLRAYGQNDPLVEYKKESRKKFSELMAAMDMQIVYSVYKIGLVKNFTPPKQVEVKLDSARKKGGVKIGRNDPCPCGSGKKYKKCCYPKYE